MAHCLVNRVYIASGVRSLFDRGTQLWPKPRNRGLKFGLPTTIVCFSGQESSSSSAVLTRIRLGDAKVVEISALAQAPEPVWAVNDFDFHGMGSATPSAQIISTVSSIDGDYGGPIELREYDPWAIPEVGPFQTAASVALTAAITVLLVRSLRRRSQRAKAMRVRSEAVEDAASREGVERRKEAARKAAEAELANKPTALGTFMGAAVAATISFFLYQFTTAVEDGLYSQPISDQYTARNITVAVRTIITGLLYLATFVFGANAVGLSLYAVQIMLGLVPEGGPAPPQPPAASPDAKAPTSSSGSERQAIPTPVKEEEKSER